MQFHFSIRNSIQKAWQLFTKHATIYIVIALVIAILNLDTHHRHVNTLLAVVSSILSLVVTYIAISVTLAVIDGKEEKVGTVQGLFKHLPTVMQWLKVFGVSIIVSLPIMVALGLLVTFGIVGLPLLFMGVGLTISIGAAYLILVVIPVIYVSTRLMFATISFVDRQKGVRDAIRYSWSITKGTKFWTIFLTVVVLAILLILVGICTFGFGLIVAYPIALLVVIQLYRALEGGNTTEAVEPVVVSDTTETTEAILVEEK